MTKSNLSSKTDTARLVVGSRKSETRTKLIEAAISCLSEKGFSGTNMRLVADRAGVTQGPRQYYFPSPTDLYVAVVKHIHGKADNVVSDVINRVKNQPVEVKLNAIMKPAFEHCGSPRHLAMLELKLACRGDDKLYQEIHPIIAQYEAITDTTWVRIFEDCGLSSKELIHIRSIFAATLRGLGVALAAGEAKQARTSMRETLTPMLLAALENRR